MSVHEIRSSFLPDKSILAHVFNSGRYQWLLQLSFNTLVGVGSMLFSGHFAHNRDQIDTDDHHFTVYPISGGRFKMQGADNRVVPDALYFSKLVVVAFCGGVASK